jgi:hypothetical protein
MMTSFPFPSPSPSPLPPATNPPRYLASSSSSSSSSSEEEERISAFLAWFEEGGGRLSPSVTLGSSPDFGGLGLMATPGTDVGGTGGSGNTRGGGIRHLDELFSVPSSLVVTAKSISERYLRLGLRDSEGSSEGGSVWEEVGRAMGGSPGGGPFSGDNHMPRQDYVLALHLMAECAVEEVGSISGSGSGSGSRWGPYLALLPREQIPRLDTFAEEHLELLGDPYLARLARESRAALGDAWRGGAGVGGSGNRPGLEGLASGMAVLAAEDAGVVGAARLLEGSSSSSCLTFESFHRHVALASSRAMVLGGVKHLVPLADMANHMPRGDGREPGGNSQSFLLYHEKVTDGGDTDADADADADGEDWSIVVRADREVAAGGQIFEDYGDTDNSLYLEAHGFVPDPGANPFHCSVIPPSYVVRPSSLPGGVRDVLEGLGVLPPRRRNAGANGDDQDAHVPGVCVRPDGSVSDRRAEAYLAVTQLLRETDGGAESSLLAACLAASRARDEKVLHQQCVRYPGCGGRIRRTIRSLSRRAYCNALTTVDEDAGLLRAGAKEARGDVDVRAILAIRFRLAEKELLARVGSVPEGDRSSICATPEEQISTGADDGFSSGVGKGPVPPQSNRTVDGEGDRFLELEAFVRFLDSLSTPDRKIRPQVVAGMGIGAVATEDISPGEAYLSISESSSISIDSSIVSNDDRGIQAIIDRHRSSQDDGGFRAVLIFLLHERFVAKKNGRWWPYLQLLPSEEDLKASKPLFFSLDRLDYLAGSDLQNEILKYQQRAAKLTSWLSTDYRLVKALGPDVALDKDKVLWAIAILDSRSIWWDGKRHLVPLLDLVNCLEIVKQDGASNRVHETVLEKEGGEAVAVTRSSYRVKANEELYENYGQPNFTYFMYHGFILKQNSHDCAIWKELSIEQAGADISDGSDANVIRSRLLENGFSTSSLNPAFCIRGDGTSLGRVADFLRIKHGLDGKSLGLADDVHDILRESLEKRLRRYDSMKYSGEVDSLPQPERNMLHVVESEVSHFREALTYLDKRISKKTT